MNYAMSTGNYTVHFFDVANTLTRRAAHSTLARAAQDAKVSVNDADGPERAEVYDREGHLMWDCCRPAHVGSSLQEYRQVMREMP